MSEEVEKVEMSKEVVEQASVKIEKCAVLLNSTANKMLADIDNYCERESLYALSHLMEFIGETLQPLSNNLGEYW